MPELIGRGAPALASSSCCARRRCQRPRCRWPRAGGRPPGCGCSSAGMASRGPGGPAGARDGRLTHEQLYDELLATLHAGAIDLVVDACHAEAIVRPRDLRAASVATSPGSQTYSSGARWPLALVGALHRQTSAEQTQEWDAYRSGIFTHEVLSALRGAADIDGDRRIEYSEMAAFLSAANRSVLDRAPAHRPWFGRPTATPRRHRRADAFPAHQRVVGRPSPSGRSTSRMGAATGWSRSTPSLVTGSSCSSPRAWICSCGPGGGGRASAPAGRASASSACFSPLQARGRGGSRSRCARASSPPLRPLVLQRLRRP